MTATAENPRNRSSSATLSGLLEKIEKKIEQDGADAQSRKLSLDDILEIIGRRAYGPILVVIGVMSISPLAMLPGSTWIFAVVTLVVALQMAVNRKQLWLPPKALKVKFEERQVDGALKKVKPITRAVDRLIKPRFEFLAHEPWLAVVAVVAVVAAVVTFPLSFIPLAPFLPGVAIILVGLGVTARDGLVLGVAVLLTAAGVVWLGMRFF